ncbi:MAG: GGIII-like transmembrane region-containing protein, partial [Candidatus Heimdallarchaeaceae archaeon]
QSSYLPMLFGGFADDLDYGFTFNRDNETLSALWWHYVYDLENPSPLVEREWNCTSSFSYDMTTGILLEADSHTVMNGSYGGDNYVINTDYNVQKTDVSDFMEFLNKNKWYFIGGGGGLVVLILTFAIIIRVRKRR